MVTSRAHAIPVTPSYDVSSRRGERTRGDQLLAPAGGLDHLFHGWLIARRLVAEDTAKDYLRSVYHVARHAGIDPTMIRAVHLEAFLNDPDYSWHTKQLRLIAVRIWHRWGAERQHWPLDPDLMDTKLRKAPKEEPPALTLDQAVQLLRLADSSAKRRIVYPGLLAGLRPREIIDLSDNLWFVGAGGIERLWVQGKQTSPRRKVPVHPTLARMKTEILSVRMTRYLFRKTAASLQASLGVEGFTIKWLRATFSQALKERGVERAVIGGLLGHSNLGVTADHYVPPTLPEMAAALLELPYGNVVPFIRGEIVQMRLF